jgi:hypothetical protein
MWPGVHDEREEANFNDVAIQVVLRKTNIAEDIIKRTQPSSTKTCVGKKTSTKVHIITD